MTRLESHHLNTSQNNLGTFVPFRCLQCVFLTWQNRTLTWATSPNTRPIKGICHIKNTVFNLQTPGTGLSAFFFFFYVDKGAKILTCMSVRGIRRRTALQLGNKLRSTPSSLSSAYASVFVLFFLCKHF